MGMGWVWALKFNPHGSPAFYWSAIVTIAVCCTIFSYLTLNNRDLEKVTESHSNWYQSKDWVDKAVKELSKRLKACVAAKGGHFELHSNCNVVTLLLLLERCYFTL